MDMSIHRRISPVAFTSNVRSRLRLAKSVSPPMLSAAKQVDNVTDRPLVRTVLDMVQEAAAASARAAADGKQRQTIQFINPVNEKEFNFMAIDTIDYPCSNMKEFDTVCGLTRSFLAALLGDAVPVTVRRIDEGGLDGDLCAIVSAGGKRVVAVVWPTAEKLKQLKKLAEDKDIGQLFIINSQWRLEGNLMSEFGVGPWRKANEDFINTFEPVFWLKEQRVGAPSSVNVTTGARYSSGAVLRTQRSYPGQFVAYVMAGDASSQAILQTPGPPSYQQLEAAIAKAREAKLEIFDVARRASSTSSSSKATPSADAAAGTSASGTSGAASASSGGGGADAKQLTFYTKAQIMEMEPGKLKRLLISLGLPSSGSLQKLQQRALAVSAAALDDGLELEVAIDVARALR